MHLFIYLFYFFGGGGGVKKVHYRKGDIMEVELILNGQNSNLGIQHFSFLSPYICSSLIMKHGKNIPCINGING